MQNVAVRVLDLASKSTDLLLRAGKACCANNKVCNSHAILQSQHHIYSYCWFAHYLVAVEGRVRRSIDGKQFAGSHSQLRTMVSQESWLSLYETNHPKFLNEGNLPVNALEMFKIISASHSTKPLLLYYGTTLTVGDVDRMSDALACALMRSTNLRRGMLSFTAVYFAVIRKIDWVSDV